MSDTDNPKFIIVGGGPGGSPGVEFLRQSPFNPIFPDLWDIRHRL